jgi:hypothetical protein
MTNCCKTPTKMTNLKICESNRLIINQNWKFLECKLTKRERICVFLFTHQIWRNKWEFVVIEIQKLKWSEKTNLCGKYCDLISREIKTFKSCQWGECCGRNWSDYISTKIQMNKIWRKLWWKLIQFVIVTTQVTQMKKWWNIIRKFCQLIVW